MKVTLNGFLDFSRTDAAGADMLVDNSAFVEHADFLDIRFPYSLGLSIRVAHIVAELN